MIAAPTLLRRFIRILAVAAVLTLPRVALAQCAEQFGRPLGLPRMEPLLELIEDNHELSAGSRNLASPEFR